jgi:hypothetical protein
MKIRLMGAQFFHADRQTDVKTEMTKLIVAFRNLHTRLKLKIENFVLVQNEILVCYTVPKSKV